MARAALQVIKDESLVERSAELGAWFLSELKKIDHPDIKEIRGLGLLVGMELKVPARAYCERLQELGLLCKETHDYVIRIAPPLVVKKDELEWAIGQIRTAFES